MFKHFAVDALLQSSNIYLCMPRGLGRLGGPEVMKTRVPRGLLLVMGLGDCPSNCVKMKPTSGAWRTEKGGLNCSHDQ